MLQSLTSYMMYHHRWSNWLKTKLVEFSPTRKPPEFTGGGFLIDVLFGWVFPGGLFWLKTKLVENCQFRNWLSFIRPPWKGAWNRRPFGTSLEVSTRPSKNRKKVTFFRISQNCENLQKMTKKSLFSVFSSSKPLSRGAKSHIPSWERAVFWENRGFLMSDRHCHSLWHKNYWSSMMMLWNFHNFYKIKHNFIKIFYNL